MLFNIKFIIIIINKDLTKPNKHLHGAELGSYWRLNIVFQNIISLEEPLIRWNEWSPKLIH